MISRFINCILFILFSNTFFGQYVPEDRTAFNYNQIMFEFPYIEDAKGYTLFLTYDSITQPLAKDFVVKKKEKLPISLVKDLKLGKNYKWYVETTLKSGKTSSSEYHYFSILNTKMSNLKFYKPVQHYNKKSKILDGIVWCDEYRCAVDRAGKIVWFVADEQTEIVKTKVLRDFRFYNDGSITYVNRPNATHVDIDLNTIWQAPNDGKVSGGSREDYHHDFKMLPNGNYMILGNEQIKFANENPTDTLESEKIDFSNIIEYDKKGNVVWFWRMKDHFPYELLINSEIETNTGIVNPHANSFCVDEKEGFVYMSFRDISRIIKIDKKSKNIVASYGQKLKSEDDVIETDLFRLQHDIQYLGNNQLLIFNNNEIAKGKISAIEVVSFPKAKGEKFELKWKFDLNYDKFSEGKVDRMGGVKIMPNGNYLVCEGSSNRVVEINKKGELLWDFCIEQINADGKFNDKFGFYRANFSSSLYPNYFSFYVNSKNELIICNKGIETDKYQIKVYDENNVVLFSAQSKEVNSNKIITIKTPLTNLKNLRIEVISTNTQHVKTKN